MVQESKVTYSTSTADIAVSSFGNKGFLDNQEAPIQEPSSALFPMPVLYAISRDLGTIQATQAPIVWAIGYTTDPAISYPNPNQSHADTLPQQRSPYYKLQYPDDQSMASLCNFG